MGQEAYVSMMNRGLVTVLLVSAPALGLAILIGVVVGLLQALTQVQDQTLPQAVKLVAVILLVLFLGPVLATQVAALASQSLDSFPALTR